MVGVRGRPQGRRLTRQQILVDPVAPPPAPRTAPATSARSTRRAAQVASLPLALLALTFFLPFVDQCGTGAFQSAAGYVRAGDDAVHGLWLLPPFVGAALLAGLTWWASLRREGAGPGRGARVVALVVLAAAAGADAMWLVAGWGSGTSFERRYAEWSLAALATAALLLIATRKLAPWSRWLAWLATHALLASPLCWVLVSAGDRARIGDGGWLFVVSLALVLVVAGGAATLVVRGRWRDPGQ